MASCGLKICISTCVASFWCGSPAVAQHAGANDLAFREEDRPQARLSWNISSRLIFSYFHVFLSKAHANLLEFPAVRLTHKRLRAHVEETLSKRLEQLRVVTSSKAIA